jgi:hypothetical protein
MEGNFCLMKIKFFSDSEIIYTGEQLRSHWIYEKFNLLGDAAVAFIGEADVRLDHMVDLQDVKELAPIYSTSMLHFIVEHFGITVKEAVLRQRLFICIIQDLLNKELAANSVLRDGDDLFFDGGKLSVSIATVSPLSALIHIGLNIDSKNAPVKASGLLSEMNIKNINNLAIQCLRGYTIEHLKIESACCKVKAVR